MTPSLLVVALVCGLLALSAVFVVILWSIWGTSSQKPKPPASPPPFPPELHNPLPPTLRQEDGPHEATLRIWKHVATSLGMRFTDTTRDNTPGLCTIDGEIHNVGVSLVALERSTPNSPDPEHVSLLSASLPHNIPLPACKTIMRALQKRSARAVLSAFHCSYETPSHFKNSDELRGELLFFVDLIRTAAAPHKTQANPIPPINELRKTLRSTPTPKSTPVSNAHLRKTTPAPRVQNLHRTVPAPSPNLHKTVPAVALQFDPHELEDTVQDSDLTAAMLREHMTAPSE